MANMKVRHFVEKPGGRFFWQPSAALRQRGWKSERLSDDKALAIARAQEINDQVDAWRAAEGEAAPRGKPTAYESGTVSWLIHHPKQGYLASHRFTRLVAKSQYDYRRFLGMVEAWAGDKPARAITRKHVQDFYAAMRPRTPSQANAVIRVLRILFKFAWDNGYVDSNPAEKPGLSKTPPRVRVWTREELAALVAAADVLELPSIGDGALLAAYTGQRQGDLLSLTWLRYQDGKIRLRQSKRGAQIEIPATPWLRERLDAARDRLDAWENAAPTILVREDSGQPYTGDRGDRFRKLFAQVREAAAREVPSIGSAWFMDLRDTAVTWLAEAGCTIPEISAITGHSERSALDVLEHYLALNSAMASSAIAKLVAHHAAGEASPTPAVPVQL